MPDMKNKVSINDLWKEYRLSKNLSIKQEIATYYTPYVKKISVKVSEKLNWRISPDELASSGYRALMNIIDKYEEKYGVNFESFASKRIHGAMIDELRDNDWIPRSVKIKENQFEKAKNRIQSKLGHHVTEEEVFEHLGIGKKYSLKNRRKYISTSVSSLESRESEEEVKNDQNINLIDNKLKDPNSNIVKKEFYQKIVQCGLTETEIKILQYYYAQEFTMEQIAKRINLSESRISQLHKTMIGKIRQKANQDILFKEEITEMFCNSK